MPKEKIMQNNSPANTKRQKNITKQFINKLSKEQKKTAKKKC